MSTRISGYDKFASGSHMACKLHKMGFASLERNRDTLIVQELRKKKTRAPDHFSLISLCEKLFKSTESMNSHTFYYESFCRIPMSFSPDPKALCSLKQYLLHEQFLALQDTWAHRDSSGLSALTS